MQTGTVSINPPESRLDGTFLAICGSPNPFGAATAFLQNKGISDGDRITVTGTAGQIGNVPVICMTDATPAA